MRRLAFAAAGLAGAATFPHLLAVAAAVATVGTVLGCLGALAFAARR